MEPTVLGGVIFFYVLISLATGIGLEVEYKRMFIDGFLWPLLLIKLVLRRLWYHLTHWE